MQKRAKWNATERYEEFFLSFFFSSLEYKPEDEGENLCFIKCLDCACLSFFFISFSSLSAFDSLEEEEDTKDVGSEYRKRKSIK